MKLKDKISWLMGSVQRCLFPHLDECLDVPLTEQEKRFVTIFEIVQVEKHVPKNASTQWLGRKNLEREALARSFVAKDLYRHPTTRDLIRALKSTTKMNAKGYKTSWNGFKLHLDITDVGLPVSALVTSASLHDSQVAIPLIKLTSGKVTYFYDRLKENFGANNVMVRGAAKVTMHLMFGVITLFADQLIQLLG